MIRLTSRSYILLIAVTDSITALKYEDSRGFCIHSAPPRSTVSAVKMSEIVMHLRLRGGLGNQCFQIIGAANHAKRLGIPLVIDDYEIFRHRDITRRTWSRQYDWNYILNFEEVSWRSMPDKLGEKIRVRIINRGGTSLTSINEQTLTRITRASTSLVVRDFFANKEYVQYDSSRLDSKCFEPKRLRKSVKRLWELIASDGESLTIHIRLGDFLDPKNRMEIPWKHYESSLLSLVNKGYSRVYLFSDDLPIARAFLRDITCNQNSLKIITPETDIRLNPVELLWVMSSARVLVQSNSTLCWWAGALSPNKLVYSPFPRELKLETWQ